MFLVKAIHCLLLWSAILGAVLVVVRSEVRLGELGVLWHGGSSPLMMGIG